MPSESTTTFVCELGGFLSKIRVMCWYLAGAVAGQVVGARCEDNGLRSECVTVLRTRNLSNDS